MLSINLSSPISIMNELKQRFKDKRLFLNLTQEGLATRSAVSLGSLKRFESSGQISLESLLKLALVLECLDDFQQIALPKKQTINSIDDLYKEKKQKLPKKGRIK